MFGLESLDVITGIITVYLIFSLACTAIVEATTAWFDVRSKTLEIALKEFLHGQISDQVEFTAAFFAHPIVQSLSIGEKGRPSYITPELVGKVVVALLVTQQCDNMPQTAIDLLPGTIHSNRIKGLLTMLLSEAQGDMNTFRKLIEKQYDEIMDRASGWYKRKTQTISLIVAAILVIFANVDTVSLANSLSSNPAARAKMVELAQNSLTVAKQAMINSAASATTSATTSQDSSTSVVNDHGKNAGNLIQEAAKTLVKSNANLTSAGIQLGWQGAVPDSLSSVINKIIGLLISILAISLGAPFWFDMLNRIMNIRAAGVSPREKEIPCPVQEIKAN